VDRTSEASFLNFNQINAGSFSVNAQDTSIADKNFSIVYYGRKTPSDLSPSICSYYVNSSNIMVKRPEILPSTIAPIDYIIDGFLYTSTFLLFNISDPTLASNPDFGIVYSLEMPEGTVYSTGAS
jgi:hypothetical protein